MKKDIKLNIIMKFINFNMIKSFEQFIKESEDLFVPRNLKGRQDKFLRNIQRKLDSCNGIWEDDLNLSKIQIPKWFKIPDNLRVSGSLDLSDTNISELPKNLQCLYLYLRNCKNIKELPEGLKIKSTISLSGSSIEQLPENLQCEFLYLDRCQNIKELPDGLKVEYISLSESSIERLSKNLQCEDLWLDRCKNIKELPEGLKIEYVISISGSSIERLPKNLQCEKLYLDNCKNINELPEGLHVNYLNVKGSGLTKQYCERMKQEEKIYYKIINFK